MTVPTAGASTGSRAPAAPVASVPGGPVRRAWSPAVLLVPALAALAVLVRFARGGGVSGLYADHGYDDGVYVAAAFALVHGRVPYADFLLLHPPGVMVALAPFAALARWTGDANALATARVGWMLLGALNTLGVAWLARRWGRVAALVAGLLYALLPIATVAEDVTLIEPLGTFALLVSVACLERGLRLRGATARTAAWTVAGGLVLGLVPGAKIWGVAPVAVVLVWVWAQRGVRTAAGVGALSLAGFAMLAAPFAVVAGPGRMWREVVVDQLGRGQIDHGLLNRVQHVVAVQDGPWGGSAQGRSVAMVVVLLVLTVTAVAAWTARRGRLWVGVLVVQLAVLIAAPSFFDHYAASAAPAVVLVIAAGVSVLPWRAARLAAAVVAAGAVVVVTGAAQPKVTPIAAFPVQRVQAAVGASTCLRADSPVALVLLGRLSDDLDDGCPLPVDLSGITFDDGVRGPAGTSVPRVDDPVYQAAVLRYLDSGRDVVLLRLAGNGFSAATMSTLLADRTLIVLPRVRVLVGRR